MGTAASYKFEPSFDLIKEDECDSLLLYLPGFKKEQLRVLLVGSRILRITGTRPLDENKWSSFQKDFPVSENCYTSKITAKFESRILYVWQPKRIVPAKQEKDSKLPDIEAPQPQRAEELPMIVKKDEERAITKNTTLHEDPVHDQIKQTIPGNEEQKPMNEEEKKETRLDDDKKAEERGSLGEKRENVSKNDDHELNEVDAVAKLKRARQVLNFVLVVVALPVVFALGMYVNKPISIREAN